MVFSLEGSSYLDMVCRPESQALGCWDREFQTRLLCSDTENVVGLGVALRGLACVRPGALLSLAKKGTGVKSEICWDCPPSGASVASS